MSHATLGLLGLGAIGKHVAKRAQGFGMKVIAYDVFWNEEYAAANGVEYAEPETIFRTADFISLHLPLTPETKNYVGERELSMMKPDAVLINTARGGLVDEEALLRALQKGRIYGAGLDAFAPALMPNTICFWKMAYTSSVGAAVMTRPAQAAV